MWALETSWFELVIRGTCIYFFMFILLRIWGKKHLSKMTAFDFVLLLFMSEALQNSLISDDKSLLGGMIVIATFLFWNVLMNKLSFRSLKIERFLDGVPKILVKDGKILQDTLNSEDITHEQLFQSLREEGILEVSKVKQATLETNGHISVIQH
jgi:uncharacterized membrane protein YcaP (DUF421 family)